MPHVITSVHCGLYRETVFMEENHPVCFLNRAGHTRSVKTRISDDMCLGAAAAPGRFLLGAGASAWLRKM